MSRSASLRVGSVPYLVARPIDGGLGDEPEIELSHALPARLVEQLRAGEVDVALVSSIELFRREGYGYLSGSAIMGQGFVASVQVFLRRPVEELRTVALDPASRTAQALTRVTLIERARREGRSEPRFIEVELDVDPQEVEADAWLRIGDPALRAYLAKDCPPLFNPSEAWCEPRRLPFVFAAWIVRPGIELTDEQRAAFARARERGQRNLDQLSREASRSWDLPLGPCRRYLGAECRYAPGQELSAALLAFRDAAGALGLCRADLTPRSIPIPSAPCPS
jgi:chorismate dehydratase